jgi:hypothetical protein
LETGCAGLFDFDERPLWNKDDWNRGIRRSSSLVGWEWLRSSDFKRDEVGHASIERWENVACQWVVGLVVGDEKVIGHRVQENRPSSALESARFGQPFAKGSDQDAR